MATKYFCDGCGGEIMKFEPGSGQQMKVLIEEVGSNISKLAGQFDLCGSCTRKLITDADPRKWVRCAPAPRG